MKQLKILLSGLAFAFIPGHAEAYIDPGSGAFLLQILAAIGIGIAFYFRQGWKILKSLFVTEPKDNSSNDLDQNKSQPEN